MCLLLTYIVEHATLNHETDFSCVGVSVMKYHNSQTLLCKFNPILTLTFGKINTNGHLQHNKYVATNDDDYV